MLINMLLVGAGGFLGSIGRYGIYLVARSYGPSAFPWATLIVNVSGGFLIGALWAYFERHHPIHSPWVLFLSTGVLGGFTTFSAFGLETIVLLREQSIGLAILNIVLSLVLGIGAVWLGRAIA